MRQGRDVLRLKAAGVSSNEIARRVGVASSTVRLTLKRLAAAGLSWPLPSDMTDRVLEEQLFTAAGKKQGHRRRGEPAERQIGATVKVVTIQEIGFDGFWIHRVLASNAIESHVIEAASIAVPLRRRRAKTILSTASCCCAP